MHARTYVPLMNFWLSGGPVHHRLYLSLFRAILSLMSSRAWRRLGRPRATPALFFFLCLPARSYNVHIKKIKIYMLCYVLLCYVMLCCVIFCYVMLCYVMLCYGMVCHLTLRHVMIYHVRSADFLMFFTNPSYKIPTFCLDVFKHSIKLKLPMHTIREYSSALILLNLHS